MTTDMITVANKLASDKLHRIKDDELVALWSENRELRARLLANTADVEIERGRVFRLIEVRI